MNLQKLFLLAVFVCFGSLAAQDNNDLVDTRLLLHSHTATATQGCLEIDLQLHNDGSLTRNLKGVNNAFMLGQTLVDLNPMVEFLEPRLLPGDTAPGATPYQRTEDYSNATGRVRAIYSYNGQSYSSIGPEWATLVRVRITYPLPESPSTAVVSWWQGLPTYYVVDETNANITGEALTVSADLEALSLFGLPTADYGDAPAPYPTTGAEAARHTVLAQDNPYLGSSVDKENDGQPNQQADGDGDDEDGITFYNNGNWYSGVTYPVTVNTVTGGFLNAWIDFSNPRDGWTNSTPEKIFSDEELNDSGDQRLWITIPPGTEAGPTFSRWRITRSAGQASEPGGDAAAPDGEVEDHRLVVLQPAAFDLGDADVDQTLPDVDEDGARHVVGSELYLGSAPPDAETAVVKNNLADYDDNQGSADEEGVSGWPSGHILVKGNHYVLTITSSGPGYVSAWADWNWLGDVHHFDADSERLLNDQPINGAFTFNVTVPNDGRSGRSFMRFRLCSLPGVANQPVGSAFDGEVEDYYIDIQEPSCVVDFAADHTSGYVGQASATISFQSTITSTLAEPGQRSYSWNFGDGHSDTQVHPVHTYEQAGVFTVTLTVQSECGEQSKTCQDYIHIETVPTATVDYEYGAAGLPPARQLYDSQVWIGRVTTPDQTWVDTDSIPDDVSENDGLEFGPLEPGSEAQVSISVSRTGVLAGWMDFNHDGDWMDQGESIIPAQALVGGIVHTFTFMVPADAQAGTEMWARFRYAGQQENGLEVPVSVVSNPTGFQDDYAGEVQDYNFRLTPVELALFVAMVNNGGVQLEWRTGSETENMGFLLYRADTENGFFEQISRVLIPGAGTSSSAHTYRYNDNTAQTGRTYFYKLADVDFNGRMTLHGPVKAVLAAPDGYMLEQNYPNPFNPETRITFLLKEAGHATVSVFNLKGQKVRELISRELAAGTHMVTWNGKDANGKVLPSGTYLYKLQVNEYEETRKMEFLK